MNPADWRRLKYFKPEENWGEPNKMDFSFMQVAHTFREFIGTPMIVTSGIHQKHAPHSLHYSGCAADFVFPEEKFSLVDLFLAATRFPFSEIGLYRDWNYMRMKVGGLHLGKSPYALAHKKYWTAVADKNGENAYGPLSEETLRFYFTKEKQ